MNKVRSSALALLLVFIAFTFAVALHFHPGGKEARDCQMCQAARQSLQHPSVPTLVYESTDFGIVSSVFLSQRLEVLVHAASQRAPPLS